MTTKLDAAISVALDSVSACCLDDQEDRARVHAAIRAAVVHEVNHVLAEMRFCERRYEGATARLEPADALAHAHDLLSQAMLGETT